MRPLCGNWQEAGVCDALRRLAKGAGIDVPDCMISGALAEAGNMFDPPSLRAAASARVLYGATLEEHAKETCRNVWPRGCTATNDDIGQKRGCQLYFDAYAAAVWTSAHAEYVASLDDGIAEPPEPCICTVPCAASGFDLSDLFARRVSSVNAGAFPKTVEPLVQLLSRATNPGARGWDSVLARALEHPGIRQIVQHALMVCLTGLHPQLHPTLRPAWQTRLKALRVIQPVNAQMESMAGYVKEAVRRYLASIMAVAPAMHAALSGLGHPVRHLHQPPQQFPHAGMEAAMAAFCDACNFMVTSEDASDLAVAIEAAFRVRGDEDDVDAGVVPPATNGASLRYDHSWLGCVCPSTCVNVCCGPPPTAARSARIPVSNSSSLASSVANSSSACLASSSAR